ncbi:hypothetical protein ASE00_18700 [Sphingomonas sp. Root710]|uniref:hypothetical protein n=1 Tax=Sphingomonas sp. Root710 TaxID=1736594 RepID=UPI0006FE8196|nr:hypothetical protein [Sphingomonas sp. Root710]KRB79743.1 hypothetical protein ASE00_18700 [Sphingomonas sp. Root710]
MLVAPLAMTMACGQPTGMVPAAGHCAENGGGGDQHGPTKQSQCSGVCSAVEVAVPRIAVRMVTRPAAAPIPMMSSLGGILLEGDTPPPRHA